MSEFKSFTQGLFEILLPGSFLLLNCVVFLCIAAGVAPMSQIMPGAEKWGIVEAVPVLGAAYILGMVLRMLRTEVPDRVSGWCLGHIPPRLPDREDLKERFFYPNWMRNHYLPSLPPAATGFFNQVWAGRFQKPGPGARNPNTQFFNFLKTLLLAINKDASERVMASEAVSRFVASSFWALLICSVLAAIDSCLLLAGGASQGFRICFMLFWGYLVIGYGVVRCFRYLRCKEVAFVFEATFAHQEAVLRILELEESSAKLQADLGNR